jgi:hypothetical protein
MLPAYFWFAQGEEDAGHCDNEGDKIDRCEGIEWCHFSDPGTSRPRVLGFSGAEESILILEGVGREPDPTAVFWVRLD